VSQYNEVWLVGGGLSEPWTYEQLLGAIASSAPSPVRASCVADVLMSLGRVIARGGHLELEEPMFGGEGAYGSAGEHAGHSPISLAGLSQNVVTNQTGRVTLRTSGTSGAWTAVTHELSRLARAVVVSERHRNDIWGLAFNPAHIAGVQVYLQALANANTLVNLWGISPVEAVARCREWRVSHLSATPTWYRMFTAERCVLTDVRSVTTGGEAADDALIALLRTTFPNARIHNIYASTEAGTLLVSDGVEFSIPRELADTIEIREKRIWVNRRWLGRIDGETVKQLDGEAVRLWRDPDVRSQRSAFGVSAFSDAWYDTGDVVEMAPNDPSRFRIVGRQSGMVNVGGEKVNPGSVEAVLREHPGVGLVRVYGRGNSVTGQILAADIVPKNGGVTEQQLREFAAVRLPPASVPRLMRFVERLELTRSGKVQRSGEVVPGKAES